DQIKTRLIANENRVGKLLEIYQYILNHGIFLSKDLGKEKEFESELRLSGLVVRRNGGLEVFNPNSQFIASGADDNTIRLWDLKGNLIEKFKGHEQSVKSVAFSLDGLSIFSSSDDETVRIWDLQSSFVREFKEHWPNVRSITFNRDGNLIATASENQAGRVWDLQGNLIVKLEGHQDWVTSIAFSPDSQLLFTSSWDKKIRIWNRQGSLIREFKAYDDDEINDMALSPDGKYLASGASDGTARLWRVESLDELLARGCHRLSDYFISHPQVLKELPVCEKILHTP
ncbi:MAG: WD40 repeat domain-containing protein, partial [Dolichospermum sp.]